MLDIYQGIVIQIPRHNYLNNVIYSYVIDPLLLISTNNRLMIYEFATSMRQLCLRKYQKNKKIENPNMEINQRSKSISLGLEVSSASMSTSKSHKITIAGPVFSLHYNGHSHRDM